MEALDKYLEATQDHLGVEGERYGGGYRAIVAHRVAVDFLFDMLDGDDFQASEAQAFLGENPLFPSAWGFTPQEALNNLDQKISILYEFEPSAGVYKWKAKRRFVLKAQYDADNSGARGLYDVHWVDIINDLKSSSLYYYEESKLMCGDTVKRDLHALVSFKYEGALKSLISA